MVEIAVGHCTFTDWLFNPGRIWKSTKMSDNEVLSNFKKNLNIAKVGKQAVSVFFAGYAGTLHYFQVCLLEIREEIFWFYF